jgi:hypothetical protein
MLEELQHIVSGDDTDGNVAGFNHFEDVSVDVYEEYSKELWE